MARNSNGLQAMPDEYKPTDIFIPVMGVTGSGKSKFISLCTEEPVVVGHDLLSCTSNPAIYSLVRNGQVIRLVDTPGFDDSRKTDIQILTDLAWYLTEAYQTEPSLLLSGAVYLQPIHEPRLQGTARKNLAMLKLLIGKEALHSVVLATTMWSELPDEADGWKRQKQLQDTQEFWADMIAQGSKVFRHTNTRESALGIIDHIVAKREKVVLAIQKQMVDGKMNIDETDAGKVQRGKILEEKEKAERRLKQNQEELDEKLRVREQESARELIRDQEKYRAQIDQKNAEIDALNISVAQLRREKEEQMLREEEELQDFYAAQDAKVSEMVRELTELKRTQSDDQRTLKETRSAGYDNQALLSRMQDNENLIRTLSEQIDDQTKEKELLKQQESKKFMKRSMQYGGAGALFGAVAAAGAGGVLCMLM